MWIIDGGRRWVRKFGSRRWGSKEPWGEKPAPGLLLNCRRKLDSQPKTERGKSELGCMEICKQRRKETGFGLISCVLLVR